eukprot:scaffold18055_cov63-Attheya_sp.AAC.2
MDDPNHPDAFAVRLQPTQRMTYWDLCNSLHAGEDINERRVVQRVWKEELDDYDKFAEIKEMLMETGADENDPALLEVMTILDDLDDFVIDCQDVDAVHGLGFRIPRVIRVAMHRSLHTMSDQWAYAYLRFSVQELRQIFVAFRLDDILCLGNRYVFNSKEAFIIKLFCLTTGMPFTKMAQDIFLDGAICLALLMDCNGKETMTPGTGPMSDYPGAPRHPDADVLQGGVYSEYMKYHGIKSQIITTPTGIIVNV